MIALKYITSVGDALAHLGIRTGDLLVSLLTNKSLANSHFGVSVSVTHCSLLCPFFFALITRLFRESSDIPKCLLHLNYSLLLFFARKRWEFPKVKRVIKNRPLLIVWNREVTQIDQLSILGVAGTH